MINRVHKIRHKPHGNLLKPKTVKIKDKYNDIRNCLLGWIKNADDELVEDEIENN